MKASGICTREITRKHMRETKITGKWHTVWYIKVVNFKWFMKTQSSNFSQNKFSWVLCVNVLLTNPFSTFKMPTLLLISTYLVKHYFGQQLLRHFHFISCILRMSFNKNPKIWVSFIQMIAAWFFPKCYSWKLWKNLFNIVNHIGAYLLCIKQPTRIW